ncbi:helix-turn-helix transcriptional regulator [Variovorax defluvii]|uniref:Helix-turn-helix transcriptional regulator n=1 Tax=Variovorax defluvii TaxID=913761 RepID=A0ABP8H5Z7_9BURK
MRQVLSVSSQLSPWLKAARKEAGLSQQELAARLGISQSRVSHMELHPGTLSVEQLLDIFSVLGLEIMIGPKPSTEASDALGLVARESSPPEW